MRNGQSGAGMMACTFSHVHTLAISEFPKDFPLLAARCGSLVSNAAVSRRGGGGVAGSLRDGGADGGAPVPEFVTPPSNTGVNNFLSLAQGSKSERGLS